jgi:hypothetical protein
VEAYISVFTARNAKYHIKGFPHQPLSHYTNLWKIAKRGGTNSSDHYSNKVTKRASQATYNSTFLKNLTRNIQWKVI